MRGTVLVLVALSFLSGSPATAQEQLPLPSDAQPAPVEVMPAPVPGPVGLQIAPYPGVVYPMAFYRTSTYEHWQYRSVGMDGRWRPRVISTPSGYYYLYNGQPYPYGLPPTRSLGR